MKAKLHAIYSNEHDEELVRYINLKLAALGQPTSRSTADPHFLEIAGPLLRNYYQKDQLLGDRLCPADTRIQAFLDAYLSDVRPSGAPRLPAQTFVLDRAGPGARDVAAAGRRQLLVAVSAVLPRAARASCTIRKATAAPRRESSTSSKAGLPVPADKIAVPKHAFAALLAAALRPPADVLALPFTADQDEQVRLFVSLLLRPAGLSGHRHAIPRRPWRSASSRRQAWSATWISSKTIFGNGGDPYLPENDAALDVHALDRPHRLRDSGAASGRAEEEGSRPAALRRSHRTPAARRHVLARARTSCTTTAARSKSPAATSAA